MPTISLSTRVAKDANRVIDRIVDGEALVIHLDSGDYYSLNGVGTRVWEEMDGAKTVSELANIIALEYEVTVEQAQTDVQALVDQLLSEQLVVVV